MNFSEISNENKIFSLHQIRRGRRRKKKRDKELNEKEEEEREREKEKGRGKPASVKRGFSAII